MSRTRSHGRSAAAGALPLVIALLAGCGLSSERPNTPAGPPVQESQPGQEPPDGSSSSGDIHEVIDFEAVVSAASEATGLRMGLHWFGVEGSASKMYVSVVAPTDDDRERIAAAAGPASIRVIVVEALYSLRELDGYVSSIAGVVGPTPGAAVGIKLEGEGKDAHPVVELAIEKLAADDRERIEELVPADILRVEVGTSFRPL